ncbi:MAG: hypothetical protein QW437_06545 [Fervidicoccaceae archaeon]
MSQELPFMLDMWTKGRVRHMMVSLGKTVGGLYNNNKAAISFDVSSRDLLKNGLLDIGIASRSSEQLRLRIWMDGVSLVKEFRPNYVLDLKDLKFSTVLIDVLPILKRANARSRSRVIIINSGSAPFTVTHASLFTLVGEGKEKRVIYKSGGASLHEGEKIDVSMGGEFSRVAMGAFLYAVDPPHSLEVLVDGKISRLIDLNRQAEDIELFLAGSGMKSIGLRRMRDVLGRKKTCTVLSSFSIAASAEEEREMDVDAHVKRAAKDEVVVECIVRNVGSAPVKKASLIALSLGSVVHRELLGELKEGEEVRKTISVKLPKDARSLVLRLIWNADGEVKFIEKRFREKE